MSQKLTDKEAAFIAAFTDYENPETFNKSRPSMDVAGYSPKTPFSQIMTDKVRKELATRAEDFLIQHGLEAAGTVVGVMRGTEILGANTRLKAADSILDRAGVTKKTQVEVKQDAPATVIVVPAKNID